MYPAQRAGNPLQACYTLSHSILTNMALVVCDIALLFSAKALAHIGEGSMRESLAWVCPLRRTSNQHPSVEAAM